jgi:transcriptional regulator with XRE-family HTH domain
VIKDTLGNTVREQRKAKSLTQEALALEAGVAYRFLQDIESGKQQPTVTTLFKLSRALGITPDQLIMCAWSVWSEGMADTPEH